MLVVKKLLNNRLKIHFLIINIIFFILNLFILSLVFRNYDFYKSTIISIPDGCHYFNSAIQFLKNPSLKPEIFAGDAFFPIGYPIFISISLYVLKEVIAIIVVQLIINYLTFLLYCKLILMIYSNEKKILIALYLFVTNPLFLFAPYTLNTEFISLFIITVAFYFLIIYYRKSNILFFILFSIFIGFVNYFRISTLLILPVLILSFLIFNKLSGARSALILLFAGYLTLIPFMYRNYVYYNDFSFSASGPFNFYTLFVRQIDKTNFDSESKEIIKMLQDKYDNYAFRDKNNIESSGIENPFNIPFYRYSFNVIIKNPFPAIKLLFNNFIKGLLGFNFETLMIINGNTERSDFTGFSKIVNFLEMTPLAILLLIISVINKISFILFILTIKVKSIKHIENKIIKIIFIIFLFYNAVLLSTIGVARFVLPYLTILSIFIFSFDNRIISKYIKKT